ncbi:MAG: hypothetical protein HY905_21345 [Deltaproteobacteria bacterium]|nr:hypothetical protein [Deltaproteobacteria bacterium]
MSTNREGTTPSVPEPRPGITPPPERDGGLRPDPSARDRRGRQGRGKIEQRAAEPAAQTAERQRSWIEKHGGTVVICLTFGVLVLTVVAKNACG